MIWSGPCAAFSASVLSAGVVAGGLMRAAAGARGHAGTFARSAGGLTADRLSGRVSCEKPPKNASDGMVKPLSSRTAAPAVAVLARILCVKIMTDHPWSLRNDPCDPRPGPQFGLGCWSVHR